MSPQIIRREIYNPIWHEMPIHNIGPGYGKVYYACIGWVLCSWDSHNFFLQLSPFRHRFNIPWNDIISFLRDAQILHYRTPRLYAPDNIDEVMVEFDGLLALLRDVFSPRLKTSEDIYTLSLLLDIEFDALFTI